MQQVYLLQPPPLYMVQIVLTRLADMQPRQLMIYVGLLTTIAALKSRGETVTASSLADFFGSDYPNMTRFVNNMVKAGILEQRPIRNRQGRGRAKELFFVETKELRELLGFRLPIPPEGELDR